MNPNTSPRCKRNTKWGKRGSWRRLRAKSSTKEFSFTFSLKNIQPEDILETLISCRHRLKQHFETRVSARYSSQLLEGFAFWLIVDVRAENSGTMCQFTSSSFRRVRQRLRTSRGTGSTRFAVRCALGSICSLSLLPAYLSFIRYYGSFAREWKYLFHVKTLHRGHVAKSFGLKQTPDETNNHTNKEYRGTFASTARGYRSADAASKE